MTRVLELPPASLSLLPRSFQGLCLLRPCFARVWKPLKHWPAPCRPFLRLPLIVIEVCLHGCCVQTASATGLWIRGYTFFELCVGILGQCDIRTRNAPVDLFCEGLEPLGCKLLFSIALHLGGRGGGEIGRRGKPCGGGQEEGRASVQQVWCRGESARWKRIEAAEGVALWDESALWKTETEGRRTEMEKRSASPARVSVGLMW